MKKSLIAIAAISFSLLGSAKNTERELGEIGEKVYMECISFSDKMSYFFNEEMKVEYRKDCPSLAFFIDNLEDKKKHVITTIKTNQFNPTILVASNPDEFMSNIGLITSFLIENPQKKLEIMEYINGDAEKHSPEERHYYIDELDKKYSLEKIDRTLYNNLVKSLAVIEKDSERIKNIQEKKMKIIVKVAEKFKEDNINDEDKVKMAEALINTVSSGYNEEVALIDHYIKNLKKYLKTNKDANTVYQVFNSKNPLSFEKDKLPRYTKKECEVVTDWALSDMIQEKHQIEQLPGCK